jgi:predicted TIM-barrel fold metal-dependent hydrolase
MAEMNEPIIDCDIHPYPSEKYPVEKFLPAEFREAVRMGMDVAPGSGHANPFGVNRRDADCSDPEKVARDHLDKYNIAYAVLQPIGIHVSLTRSIDVGCAMARMWNDWQVATFLAADKRFLGSVCINVNDPAKAAAEIRRIGPHPQMVQVGVGGEAFQLYGHRCYYPIYEAMAEVGLPLAMHPGREGAYHSPTPVGSPSSYIEWHCDLPLTYQAHLISLVLEGTFEKFPKLKVLITEGGVAWLAHTLWRMDKNFKSLRAMVPWLKRPPSEYVFDHVRLSTQPLEEPANRDQLLQIFEMIHAEKTLCFATDFPHWDFDDPGRVFPKKMPAELRRRIFYDNAAELYGLPKRESTADERGLTQIISK